MTALRAFEAAGRHGSFQKAAHELSVTPGAVAQQIKKLEEWAGGELFHRLAHGVTLTPLGRQVLPDLTDAMGRLAQVAHKLRREGGKTVRIAALPAVAQLWLGCRVSLLQQHVAGLHLSVHALDERPGLEQGGYDLALYPGDPGLTHQTGACPIAENSLVPVATPAVARRPDRRSASSSVR